MPNKIPTTQRAYVDLVRASREAYRRAKRIGGAHVSLSLLVAIGGPLVVGIVSHFCPASAPNTKAWIGIFAIATILIDVLFLEPCIKELQTTGARIQEQFDTKVYELPWNKVKAGAPVDAGTIGSLVSSHKTKFPDDEKFLNWYPVIVGEIPLSYARLVCQKSSMQWDSSLRNAICWIYAIILLALFIISLAYALAAGYDMQAFVLTVLMPLFPAARQVWRELNTHKETAADMGRASGGLDALWDELLAGAIDEKESAQRARLLQDELFDRRRRAPAIPEWLYQYRRDDYEARMQRVAAERVEQVTRTLGTSTGANVGANANGS